VDAAVEDGGEAAVVLEGDGDAGDDDFFLGRLVAGGFVGHFADLPVVGDVDRDFVAEGGDLAGQRAEDFAEAAGSGPGRAFGRRKNYVHLWGLLLLLGS
jgi:hypothetical protein